MVCNAMQTGAAKKGYFCEIFLLEVYYLNLLQVWVNFVHSALQNTCPGS
jgi:hypothetical protein